MGFVIPALGDVHIEFADDHRLAGLHVACRSVNAKRAGEMGRLPEQDLFTQLMDEIVVSWDAECGGGHPLSAGHECDGGPVRPDASALEHFDPSFFSDVFVAWQVGLYRVSGPLGTASTNGASRAAS